MTVIDKFLRLWFRPANNKLPDWPNGHDFAFSIVDDTDQSTLSNIRPIYNLLSELRIFSTKTVWPLATNEPEEIPSTGSSLQDPEYLDYVLELKRHGFEIALHGVRGGSSTREEIERGLSEYERLIGEPPRIHINHYRNLDNLYWGVDKVDGLVRRLMYRICRSEPNYGGHDPDSPYFWGDIALKQIKYMVNYSFHETNLANINAMMPYYDPARKFVNRWFHTSDGGVVDSFNRLLSDDNVEKLVRQNGVCLIYTHFGKGFCKHDKVNAETERLLCRLASKNGWFAPASEILAFMERNLPDDNISARQRKYVGWRWLIEKLLYGTS